MLTFSIIYTYFRLVDRGKIKKPECYEDVVMKLMDQ